MSAVRLQLKRLTLLAVLPGLALAAGPAAQAQRDKPEVSSGISVTLVEVPVEVNRGDTPITGLTAADFEVLEGKRALPIVAFEPIDLEAAAAPGAPPPPPAARRHLLLLFDFAFSRPQRLAEGLSAAREMIAKGLDPRDLVAVGLYMPKGELQLLLSFTTDRSAAERTLAGLEGLLTGKLERADLIGEPGKPGKTGKPGDTDPLRLTGMDARTLLQQVWRVDERNFSSDMLDSLGATDGTWGSFLQHNVLHHSSVVHQSNVDAAMRGHVTAMAAAMDGLAAALRPVTGRKYLALFSEGFSMDILASTPERVDRVNTDGAQVLANLAETLAELKRSGWVLHSVNIRGAMAFAAEGLFFLADQTGGTLVEGTNDLAAGLGAAMRRSAHGYLISVQADDVPLDGAYHKLEVRLRTPQRGVRLHHRGGYYAPLPFANQDDVRKLADAARLVGGDAERDDLGIQALAMPLRPGPETTPVAVLVEIPGSRLVSAGSPDIHLEVYGYALDDAGSSNDFFAQSVDMDSAKVGGRLSRGGVRVLGQLDLPPGRHRLRVLVRDRHDGRTSLLTLPLSIEGAATAATAANTAPEARIDAVFLPPAEDPWLLVLPGEKSAFDLHGRSILPAAQAAIPASGNAQLLVVGRGLAGDEALLRGRILDAAGRTAAGGGVEWLGVTAGDSGEPDMVVGRLDAGTLVPGNYLLELRLGRQIRAQAVVFQAITARPFRISAKD